MSSAPEPSYGQSAAWQPERPRLRLFPLVVSWLATGVALMVAAWAPARASTSRASGARSSSR